MRGLAFALVMTGAFYAPAVADTVAVHITNFTFNPGQITIKAGTTVTWTNDDDIPHSIIEKVHRFHSPPLDTGDTYSMTFKDPGEVDYFCGFHAMMQGKIIVTQ